MLTSALTFHSPRMPGSSTSSSRRRINAYCGVNLNQEMDSLPCLCGSGNVFSACCGPYASMWGLKPSWLESGTALLNWSEVYSIPIVQSFREKVGTYIFRVSWYLEGIIDLYFYLGFRNTSLDQEAVDEAIFYIKHNILLSLFASFSCLSQGLFLQSGAILRSLFEDCFVLVDLFENEGQVEKFLQGKYSVNGLISRVKKFIPSSFIIWYGYFSANFVHSGPLHPAPYMPRACYPDNWVLVVGLQNIVRAVVTFHLILERLYCGHTAQHLFWKQLDGEPVLVFSEDSIVFTWAEKLGEEIVSRYPPDERKEGFFYDTKGHNLK